MNAEELDNYLKECSSGEIKNLTQLMKKYSFENIEQVINNIEQLSQSTIEIDFSSMIPVTRHNLVTSKSYYHELPIAVNKHTRFIQVAKHSHPYIELTYIYSGTFLQVIEGKEILLKEGDLCILDTGTIHSIGPSKSEDIMINILMLKKYFNTAFFSKISDNRLISNFLLQALYEKQKTANHLLFETANYPIIKEIVVKICCEFFDPKICSNSLLDSFMIWLFTELLRLYEESKNKTSETDKKRNFNIGKILNYIEENYATVTLQELSDHFYFNPEYLSKKLKRVIGYSFKDLVIQERLKKSAELLKHTNFPITEICSLTGFSNLQLFYAKFIDKYKMSPATFRNSHSKEEQYKEENFHK